MAFAVAPGDIVLWTGIVISRYCTLTTMTGAIPIFLMPTRNIWNRWPILKRNLVGTISKKDRSNPFIENKDQKPRVLTITQSIWEFYIMLKKSKKCLMGKLIPYFDEAWLPHATYNFYGDYHAIGEDRPKCEDSMIFSTQSTHKLLAGLTSLTNSCSRCRK